jgi:hypothetical protein
MRAYQVTRRSKNEKKGARDTEDSGRNQKSINVRQREQANVGLQKGQ